MPRYVHFQIHRPPGLAGWLSIFVSALLLVGVVIVIAIVALGFLIFVLPVLVISGLISYFVFRSKLKRAMRQHRPVNGTIIDGEYSVIDPEQKSLPDRVPPED